MWLRASHAILAGVAGVLSAPALVSATPVGCPATEAEYALSGTLQLSDTPMGLGNGTYDIGPGRAVLRFEGKSVTMLSYTMREYFTVQTRTAFWKTAVTTNTHSSATPDACGVVAKGTLVGNTVHWLTPIRAYRTDGTLTCNGSFCGDFGAPPAGDSPFHVGPAPTRFNDFVFSRDWKTFTMAKTFATKTDVPKQTSAVTTSGRELWRTCAQPRPCAR